MEDQAKNRNTTERQSAATPEEVVAAMALSELQELLQDLGMDSTAPTGRRLQQLVIQLHSFERAIEAIGGPATLGTNPQQEASGSSRSAA